jgi:hypothetical protein
MRTEVNKKLDELIEKVGAINLTMAKWMGYGGALFFILNLGLKYVLK